MSQYPLIAQFAAGHGAKLRRFLKPRVRNSSDIPDLIQEVYLRLLRVAKQDSIRSPEAYIYTVAYHVLQQYTLRQAEHRGSLELDEVLIDAKLTSQADPLLEVSAQQYLEEFDRALSRMPPKVQATFLLVRRDGLSMEQIADRLGISVPMAKKYLVKALIEFRKCLQTMGQGAP